MSNTQSNTKSSSSTVWQIVGRLIGAAVVLAITAFFTPGFSINNLDISYSRCCFNCYRLFSYKIYWITC